ncbi:tyrosine-type recombinase/integrase [Pseudovibrio sp. Ad26]|uniref:site-specific integrase n=1 Tax=Pseudovibrio sp. Ad26 TaxID=989410 RepID=UPI0007B22915|nr:tyrosine-type recombinase/integrase [Pseudovibrio sp. Ad26]KZL09071.1 putative prophage CPS-53 integrase [Pseudovibrio sp. Ad26]
MPGRQRLTEKIARNAKPTVRQYQLFDSVVPGFALVIYKSGTKAFNVSYRVGGRQRRYTIGQWPAWSVVAARERAKTIRREIELSCDPLGNRQAERVIPHVSDLIERYKDEHLPKLAERNQADQISMLTKLVLPTWGNRPVRDICSADVNKLLCQVASGRHRPARTNKQRSKQKHQDKPKPTPIRANRLGEILRKMFNLSVQWKMREDNPADGFHKRPENARERFLSLDEINRLSAALENSTDTRGADVIRLCLLTGARLGEVRHARFEQFNLDLLIWLKPAAATKQRRTHRLPISLEVADLVRRRQSAVPKDCLWLFPGDVPGKPVHEMRRYWQGILKQADISDVRIHDLRHTFASLLVSGGASLEVIGKLLGHTQMSTTQRYAHLMESPLRESVNAVAGYVKSKPSQHTQQVTSLPPQLPASTPPVLSATSLNASSPAPFSGPAKEAEYGGGWYSYQAPLHLQRPQ